LTLACMAKRAAIVGAEDRIAKEVQLASWLGIVHYMDLVLVTVLKWVL
jgi:hypothetical protein